MAVPLVDAWPVALVLALPMLVKLGIAWLALRNTKPRERAPILRELVPLFRNDRPRTPNKRVSKGRNKGSLGGTQNNESNG